MPHARRALAALTCTAVLCAGLGATAVAAHPPKPQQDTFHRLATYPVYLNRPAGTAASGRDRRRDLGGERGRQDVHPHRRRRGPDRLRGHHGPGEAAGALGTLDLEADLGVGAQAVPTSVAVVGGYVLVVVDTSESFTDPSGVARRWSTWPPTRWCARSTSAGSRTPSRSRRTRRTRRSRWRTSATRRRLPTAPRRATCRSCPPGFLQLVDLPGTDPAAWTTRAVPFTADDLAGLDTPQDAEPEYVAVDPTGSTVAVTLQENNGVVLVDIATGTVTGAFTAGTTAVTGIDTVEDGGHRPDRVDPGDAPRAGRHRLAGRRATSPPPTRATGRAAPAAGPSSTPPRARSSGTRATSSSGSPSAPACTTRTGRRRRASRSRAWPSPAWAASATRSSARSGRTSSPCTTSTTPPTRGSCRCSPRPTARRASCRCRRATCCWSPARPTTRRRWSARR